MKVFFITFLPSRAHFFGASVLDGADAFVGYFGDVRDYSHSDLQGKDS